MALSAIHPSAPKSLHLTRFSLCFAMRASIFIARQKEEGVPVSPGTTEHYPMLTFLSLSFLIWACWRLYFRRGFLRTVLDDIPGPPGQSWLSGEEHCCPWAELSFASWLNTCHRVTRPAGQSWRMGISSLYCWDLWVSNDHECLSYVPLINAIRWTRDTNKRIPWGNPLDSLTGQEYHWYRPTIFIYTTPGLSIISS